MDTNAVILDAVERVAGGRDDALVLHSARDPDLWVQISRVEGETSLLCEAVGDEYLGRHRELATAARDELKALGWQDVSGAAFTLWAEARHRCALGGGAVPPRPEPFQQARGAPFARELLDLVEGRV